MDARIVSKLGSTVGILLMVAVLLGCSSGSEEVKDAKDSNHRQVTVLRPVHWEVNGEPYGKALHIRSDVGYCDGSPMPYIKRVRIQEHAGKALLTAMLITVARSGGVACAGVRLGVRKTVMLKRDVAGRALYDASFSPPRKRWPQ